MKRRYFNNSKDNLPAFSKKLRKDLVDRTWAIEFYLSYLVLRDEFDFNADQLEKYADKLSDALVDCSAQRFSTDDIAQMVLDETGIDITKMM